MPGLAQSIIDDTSDDNNDGNISYENSLVRNRTSAFQSFNPSLVPNNGFWSKHRDDMSYNQLQKFWCELTLQARQKLLRIDKQTLFEHARKNMYCSRCNGLLLEGFLQIVMYGKSLQQDINGNYSIRAINTQNDGELCIENCCQDDAQDPSVHPWGGLTTARDGTLTLLDCYLHSKSLRGLQNVFDSARARERERELLYPDACGGGGRGWISQGIAGYGRGHGTRETCALHTARLSVETLVDFWSALGEETRQSLLRMKEEDFTERLIYRFDSKRFCRDCRRNVIREFKELKELKRMRRDTRCTSWFCVADTAFQYEVSRDTVQADWHQTFSDTFGTYHHFEWAIGTEEGTSDIMEFENVGLSGRVQVNGLDLSGLKACYITLRAFKKDGRLSEFCVKAHALKGQQCVHYRLVVGDGFVTITRGESIRRFFEHAEEAEEEEDDDSMDKDGNEIDGECSRPQKHAKSPELARDFLLDAATVIFKEQVEKAFREGTARQNAHSIFVCLALKLLEERVHVACKEIITLEKQTKLLEEEEKEKREEEERKERKRTKEREKKLRRKERLREKENKEDKCAESNIDSVVADVTNEVSTPSDDEGAIVVSSRDSVSETGEATPVSPLSPDIEDDQHLNEYVYSNTEDHFEDSPDGEFNNTRDWNSSFPHDNLKYSRRRLKFHKDPQQDLSLKWSNRRNSTASSENGIYFSKYEPRYNVDACESTRNINGSNKQLRSNAAKSNMRNGGPKFGEKCQCINNKSGDRYHSYGCTCNHHNEYRSKPEPYFTRRVPLDVTKPSYRGNRYTEVESTREIYGRPKTRISFGNSPNKKKVWEPLDSQKKYVRSNSDSDVTLRSTHQVKASESDQPLVSSDPTSCDKLTDTSVPTKQENIDAIDSTKSTPEKCGDIENGYHALEKSKKYSKAPSTSSNSDNCSSCLSEGDSNASSNPTNLESTSTSDSEESSQSSEIRETSHCHDNGLITRGQDTKIELHANPPSSLPNEPAPLCENGRDNVSIAAQPQNVLPQMHSQSIHYPYFQASTIGYYHQSPLSWPAAPANGLMSYPHANHYIFPNTYGYGLNGNARFMQYGTLQHLPPLLNPTHLPVFQPVAQVITKEVVNVVTPKEVPEVIETETNVKPNKTATCNNEFSLFHFGGPVALSTGKKEGIVAGDISPNFLESCTSDDHTSNKKDPIEEYNLFAASNGIQFSIF